MAQETNKKTKIFWDLEFTGLHKLTTAISIGLVAEDGKEFYAEFTDYDKQQIDGFLAGRVLPKLILHDYVFSRDYNPDDEIVYVKGDIDLIAQTLFDWLSKYQENGIEMWGDCHSYDWVLFISIFGNAFDLPKFVYYLPMDLVTALRLCKLDPDVDREEFAYGEGSIVENAAVKKAEAIKYKHNSLFDARTQKDVYARLFNIMKNVGNDSLENSKIEEEAQNLLEVSKSDDGWVDDVPLTDSVEDNNTAQQPVIEIDEKQGQPSELPTQSMGKKAERELLKKMKKEVKESEKIAANKTIFVEPTREMIEGSPEWIPPI